ncbi:MAG TPA: DUF979 family protein, partial [Sphingomonas sp.]|nr:DUF979 family protein [Sphingomonas sp.]
MIGLGFVYVVAGALFAIYALLSLIDRRWPNAVFWALLALSFLAGDRIGDLANGCLVIGLVAMAGFGLMRPPQPSDMSEEGREAEAVRRRDWLFGPILIVPITALAGTLAAKEWPDVIDPRQGTLVSLAIGVLIALAVACAWLRPRPATPFREGLRLMDSVG